MTVENNEILGQIVKRQRVLEGFTQAQLSKTCGVSISQLSRVERGLCFPSAEFLVRVARPLNIDKSLLLVYAAYLAIEGEGTADNSIIKLSQSLKTRMAKSY